MQLKELKFYLHCVHGHERYTMTMETENDFFNEINHKIMHAWKVTNVVMYCGILILTNTHARRPTHRKNVYIL